MSINSVEAFDTTVQKTNEWLRDISNELGDDNRRHPNLALRGTLHAVRDFLPIEESAHLSAQLPMLVRGIYFEGWNPTNVPEKDRSRESFLSRTEQALERALWKEDYQIDTEKAARTVLRVLSDRISAGEVEQVRHVLPEPVRELWPEPVATR
ncbi:MAG: DUF2267 domain-containing protein [Chloroflexi bacterium]|nr:DUF2267 domain-containing protein [Chloroflexota bacterium]